MKFLCLLKNVENSFVNLFMLIVFFLSATSVCAQITREKKTESDGFAWYFIKENGGSEGAEDLNGRTLIPTSRGYSSVMYYQKREGYFMIYRNGGFGLCKKDGVEIISPNRNYSSISIINDNYIEVTRKDATGDYLNGACDFNGKELVAPVHKRLVYSAGKFYDLDDNAQMHPVSESSSETSYVSSSSGSRPVSTTRAETPQPNSSNTEQMVLCPVCNGLGTINYYDLGVSVTCPVCNKTGRIPLSLAAEAAKQQMNRGTSSGGNYNSSGSYGTRKKDCKVCHNTGICQSCNGRGSVINGYTGKWSYCNTCNKNYVNENNPSKKGKCYACSW